MYLYGLGDVLPGPVTSADYTDCGGGLSVSKGTPCPVITPIDLTSPAAIQAQADWNARNARCKVYESKEYAALGVLALGAVLLLPGFWKLAALPAVVIADAYYPHSEDCNYGW
jgi:hypothetical protein